MKSVTNTNKKFILWFALFFLGVCMAFMLVRFIFDFSLIIENLQDITFYLERVPSRDFVSSEKFTFLWSKETEDGSEHHVFTQIFTPDEKNLVYITGLSINSVDYETGKLLWSTDVPEDSTFYFYRDKLFSLDSYDELVPFVSEAETTILSKCNSNDKSTLRVYNPHTGKKTWEYSYHMVYPEGMYFKDDSAFISGLTIESFAKYISAFEVDIQSGQILGVTCKNLNDYSRISYDEGIISSGFYPILRDWEWEKNIDTPAFITDGRRLIMVNRDTKEPLGQIEFSGFSLNPYDVQLIIQRDLLVVYLNDSNQFFVFQIE